MVSAKSDRVSSDFSSIEFQYGRKKGIGKKKLKLVSSQGERTENELGSCVAWLACQLTRQHMG